MISSTLKYCAFIALRTGCISASRTTTDKSAPEYLLLSTFQKIVQYYPSVWCAKVEKSFLDNVLGSLPI
jgi:hypothetical protein